MNARGPERRRERDLGRELVQQPRVLQPRPGTRMQRQDDLPGDRAQQRDEHPEPRRVVDVAGAVRGRDDVLTGLDARLAQRREVLARPRLDEVRDVDHDVPHEAHGAGDALAAQVLHRGVARREQQIAEMVGEDAVELLRHPAVEGPHPRLDVRDRDPRLRRREAAGERRVRVAVDEHRVRALLGEQGPERGEHPRGLLRVRPRPEAELALGARNPQLVDEHRGQLVVVVLAGVHEDLVVLGAQRPADGGRLDELRPVADDGDDPQAVVASAAEMCSITRSLA